LLRDAVTAFETANFAAAELKDVLEAIAATHCQKLGKAQAPVRVAVTGRTVGPPLFESLEVMGRDETLRRLRSALARLGA
jgi:glutamyl-tRNA synthetase